MIPCTSQRSSSSLRRAAVALAPDQLLGEKGHRVPDAALRSSGPSRSAPFLPSAQGLLVRQGHSPPIPSARLVTTLTAATRRPQWRGDDRLGHGAHADEVGAHRRNARISAGVSKLGPLTAR